VALTALRGDKTLAKQFDAHPNQISERKQHLQEQAGGVFEGGTPRKAVAPDLQVLHAKIGQLTLENDFSEEALTKAGLLSAWR